VNFSAVDSLNECFDVDIVEIKEWHDEACTEWPVNPFSLSVAQYQKQLSAAAITGMILTPDCPAREPTCVHQRNPDQPRGTLQQYHTYSARIGSAMSLHNFPFDAHILEVGVRFPQLFKDPASFDDDKYLWIILGVSVAALLSIVGSAVINRRSTRDEFAATRSNSAGSLHKPAAMKPVAAEPVFLI